MATNYLNNLNNSIKINSASISNAESKDALVALSKRNSGDLNRVADYINALIVPTVSSLTSKPRYPYDTVESGLSGLTIVTYPEAQGNNRFNTELYWMAGPTEETGRPCTVKESFDYLLANMIDRVVEIKESVTDLNPIMDQLICSNKDLIRLAVDTFGIKYSGGFSCNSSGTKTYSIAEHVYQIINQLTGSSIANELSTGSSNYPVLSIPGAAVATEISRGVSEIATIKEIAQAAGLNDSDTNAELTVTADRLLTALSSEDAGGNLGSGEVNSLREAAKTIADERIAASNIDALANVTIPSPPSIGDALVFDGTSWTANTVNSTTLLGDRDTLPTVGDLINNLSMENGISIAYDHVSEKNVRTDSYNIQGFNFSYYRSTDKPWTKDPGINISTNLLFKHVPFVFKSSPSSNIFNTTTMETANTGLLNLGDPSNLLNPSLNKPKEIGFYQNTCSTWSTSSQSHENSITPEKIIGVCRSDFQHGKVFAEETSGNINGNITAEFQSFITSNIGTECIQESGSSKVMVLGPYYVGDRIYLCPGRILDLAGIPNNLGIAISETFINASIQSLTDGVVNVSESIFGLLRREPATSCVTISTQLNVESKSLGVITNKYNSNNDPATDPINTLCYGLVESSYNSTGANPLRLLLNQEITEIDPGANVFSAEYIELSKRYTELSLPLVKLTI